jgi:hypothetical protein
VALQNDVALQENIKRRPTKHQPGSLLAIESSKSHIRLPGSPQLLKTCRDQDCDLELAWEPFLSRVRVQTQRPSRDCPFHRYRKHVHLHAKKVQHGEMVKMHKIRFTLISRKVSSLEKVC